MENLELKVRVVEVGLGIVDVNDFKYNLVKVDTQGVRDFAVLIPIFDQVDYGDCLILKRYKVIRLKGDFDAIELCIRVESFEIAEREGFVISEYLNVKVRGILTGSEKCYLRTIGPDKRAFFMCTIKLEDDYGEMFGILLCAFNTNAKKLSTIPFTSSVVAEVTIRRKLRVPGYEMAVIKIDKAKTEVEK